jgi:hypothetical protein
METESGKLWYAVGLDNRQLQADAAEATARLRGIGDGAVAEGARIDETFKNLGKSIAAVFTLQQAGLFVSEVAKVRGEFQQLEVAFSTLLQSKERADALMQQMVETAAKTPFDLKGVADGAKQLLAYGESADNVNDTLVKLGNIASGLSIPLNDIVYLYGTTMVQGRLFSRDIWQFQGRGISLVGELSNMLGKTTQQIQEMVTAGKIGFPEVEKVINKLTGEGGKFFNLMEAQSKTIGGQIANLGDAWDTMLNSVGKSNEGLISGAIEGVTTLVENYEKVGEAIAVIVAMYGTYKAALITTAALQKASTTSMYSAEIAELSKLLPLKKASAFADVEAAVASGRYSAAEAEKLIAIRMEVAAKTDALKVEAARMATEVRSAQAAYKASLQRITAAEAEIVQLEKKVAASAAALAIGQKQLAQEQLLTAQKERAIAVNANKAATDALLIARSNATAAATAAETSALATNTAVQNANVAATSRLAIAKKGLMSVASRLGSILTNPYVLAAAAVTALGYAVYKIITADSDAIKVQKELNRLLEEAREKKEGLISKSTGYINVIQDETSSIYEQVEAWKALKKEMPETFKDMSLQQVKNTDSKELATRVRAAANTREATDAELAYAKALEKVKRAQEMSDQNISLEEDTGGVYQMHIAKNLNDAKIAAEALFKQLQKINETRREAEYESKPDNEKLEILNKQLATLKQQRDEIDRALIGADKMATPLKAAAGAVGETNTEWAKFDGLTVLNTSKLKLLNSEINAVQGNITSIVENSPALKSYGQAFASAKAEWLAASKELEAWELKAQQGLLNTKREADSFSVEQYQAAKKRADEAKKEYASLGGVTSNTATNKAATDANKLKVETEERLRAIKEAQEKIKQQAREGEMELNQIYIDLMEEGSEKRLAQIDLDFEKRKEEHAKKTAELIKQQQEIERAQWETANPKYAEKGMIFEPTTKSAATLPTEQIKALNDLMQAYTAIWSEAQKATVKELLAEYKDYSRQRTELERQFNEDVAALNRGRTDGNADDIDSAIAERTKAYTKGIKDINSAELEEVQKHSDLFVRLFTDASYMSQKRIKEVIAETKKLVAYLQGVSGAEIPVGFTEEQLKALKEDPEKIRAIYDELIEKQDELDKRNNYPFAGIIKGFGQLKEAAKIYAKALKEVDAEGKEALMQQGDAAQAKGINYLSEGAVEATDQVGKLADMMQQLADVSGSSEFADAAGTLSSMASTLSAAAKGAQSGGWIGAVVAAAGDMIMQTVDAFANSAAEEQEYRQNRLDFIAAYELALLRIKAVDFDSVFGIRSIEKAREAWEKAGEALDEYNAKLTADMLTPEKGETETPFHKALNNAIMSGSEIKKVVDAYEKGYTRLQSTMVKTKDQSAWAELWGKKDEYTALKDLAPQMWGEDGGFNLDAAKAFLETNTQISDEQRKQIQGVIDLKTAYDENIAIIDEQLQDVFGHLSGEITDAIFDSIRNGADAWDMFEDSGLKVIDALGKQLIQEMYIGAYLDTFQEQMHGAHGLGSPE